MTDLSPSLAATLDEAVNARFDDEVRFLAELVKVPSDNPPGDCAPMPSAPPNCWRRWASRWNATRCRPNWCGPTA